MLRDVWLLADLDGTLISTPHKAGGQYLSIDKSPCFDSVKRWICNGGNLCIVTTADRRVFDQVYTPLRPFLRGGTHSGTRSPGCGEMLLSIYGGAVLCRCTADGVEYSREYEESIHGVTEDAIEEAARCGVQLHKRPVEDSAFGDKNSTGFESCVKGTCLSLRHSSALAEKLEGVFFRFLQEVLEEEPKAKKAFEGMSARYKAVWNALLTYLQAQYESQGADSNAVLWKVNFLRSRPGVCMTMGFIRVSFADCSRGTRGLQGTLGAYEKSHVNLNKTQKETLTENFLVRTLGNSDESTRHFARVLFKLLGVDMESTKTAALLAESDKNTDNVVAQVIFLGIPMPLFSRYFSSMLPVFSRIGVSGIPQPNSVVFSKLGVCKSTVIRYLCATETINEKTRCGLRGIIHRETAVALGDNPQSTDFGLTRFPCIPFVSVERKDVRSLRHTRIDTKRPSMPETQRRGALMDDRRLTHLYYVGAEECGTAVFLSRLMNLLDVLPLEACKGKSESHEVVQAKAFVSAIRRASGEAHRQFTDTFAHL